MDVSTAPVDIVDRDRVRVETHECDIDRFHGTAVYAAVKDLTLLYLCGHCGEWSPRLARQLTEQGFETLRLTGVSQG